MGVNAPDQDSWFFSKRPEYFLDDKGYEKDQLRKAFFQEKRLRDLVKRIVNLLTTPHAVQGSVEVAIERLEDRAHSLPPDRQQTPLFEELQVEKLGDKLYRLVFHAPISLKRAQELRLPLTVKEAPNTIGLTGFQVALLPENPLLKGGNRLEMLPAADQTAPLGGMSVHLTPDETASLFSPDGSEPVAPGQIADLSVNDELETLTQALTLTEQCVARLEELETIHANNASIRLRMK
jgi:hypothetical protein